MSSSIFDQRLQDLADNIAKDYKLLKEFEDELFYTENPRIKAKYRREIERQRESVTRYKQEYEELKQQLSSSQSAQMQNVESQLQQTVSYLRSPPFPHLRLPPFNLKIPSWDNYSSPTSEPRQSKELPEVKPPKPDEKVRGNYSQLRELLVAGQWKEADLETAKIILEVAKRKKFGWLRAKDIENFPCSDLRIINNLWLNISQGKFGFSVQRNIWLSVGGKPGEFDGNCFLEFGNRVGWRVNDDWLKYDALSFSLDAPIGHLPSLQLTGLKNEPDWLSLWKSNFKVFLSRIETCLSHEEKNLKSEVYLI
jgi:hypothetical protein